MKILNFGSLNIDHVYRVPHLVRAGETLASQGYQQYAGGKGCNQSIALAKAGAQVHHAGLIGADGAFLQQLLQENGVDITHLKVHPGASGHAIIQVDKFGENAILLHGGTNHQITETFIDTVLQDFSQGDVLLLQNELNVTAQIMQKAAARGMIICFNPAPMTAAVIHYPLLQVNYLFLNESEAEALTGETTVEAIMAQCVQKWPNSHVILTLGAKGACYSYQNKHYQVSAPKVQAIDTTAAGDTFIGYFISHHLQLSQPINSSLEQACAAAALCVTVAGASSSIPSQQAVTTFINKKH